MSKIPHGEPYAGNPHVRFDEGAGVPDKGRTALLYTLWLLKKLHSRQDEARQKSAAKPSAQRGKNGIMRDVKSHAKSALALTLAIAGGMVAPMRSDATNHGFISAPSHMIGISHFKLMAS